MHQCGNQLNTSVLEHNWIPWLVQSLSTSGSLAPTFDTPISWWLQIEANINWGMAVWIQKALLRSSHNQERGGMFEGVMTWSYQYVWTTPVSRANQVVSRLPLTWSRCRWTCVYIFAPPINAIAAAYACTCPCVPYYPHHTEPGMIY